MKAYFSSESVACGHPDKVCDKIADCILDAILQKDPDAHVACEVTCATEQVHIFGEITAKATVDYAAIAREAIRGIGYVQSGHGFDANTCEIQVDVHEQSSDIALGIDRKEKLDSGAGDQGIMFGYACDQTQSLMPLPIHLAHRLVKRLDAVRKDAALAYLLPDGKAQVTVEYDAQGQPIRISTVVISAQHQADVDIERLRREMIETVVLPALPEQMLDEETAFFVNPTGRFVIGGPAGDSGLTGRKLIVDTYGGYARHGGGSFSGKDASKVDRSGAYMARYIAKNVVAAGLARECEVQLGYAIGLADPVSICLQTFGSESVGREEILKKISRDIDLRPEAIIQRFALRTPGYARFSCYGHFGENAEGMPWERTDLAQKWMQT